MDGGLKEVMPSVWLGWRSIKGGRVFDAPAIVFELAKGSMSFCASIPDDIEGALGWLTLCGSIWSQPFICGNVIEAA